MYRVVLVALAALSWSCALAQGAGGPDPIEHPPVGGAAADAPAGAASDVAAAATATRAVRTARDLDRIYESYRAPGLESRRFTHDEFWAVAARSIAGSDHLRREEIGRSAEGRPLYLVTYGRGPIAVLLWSQMHGNESTATMALADVFRFLAEAPEHPVARRLRDGLTVVFLPMLNPDGAERFQRRNALGIDVNRDARVLATPEGRALKAMQEQFQPTFGFNLHDQNVRISVGDDDRTAAISLLAPPFDEARSDDEVRTRAKRLAATIRHAVDPFVAGHVARYDDTFNPRAFGDLMQQWGVSTVLVESGGWRDDPEKQFLRRVHFAALLAALDAIARGAYADADVVAYEELPENGALVNDLLIRGGSVVLPGIAPFAADIAINFGEPLAREDGSIADIGDLADYRATDTLDVRGLYLHIEREPHAGAGPLSPGDPAPFTIRRGPDPASAVVWTVEAGRPRRER